MIYSYNLVFVLFLVLAIPFVDISYSQTQDNTANHPDSQQNDQTNTATYKQTSEDIPSERKSNGGSGKINSSKVCGNVLCHDIAKQPSANATTLSSAVTSTTVSDEPLCGHGTKLIDGICQVIKTQPVTVDSELQPLCGHGTKLIDGICQVIKTQPVTVDSELQPLCGHGTKLIDGICQVIKTDSVSSRTENSGFSDFIEMIYSLLQWKSD